MAGKILDSDHAILDVKKNRVWLRKRLEAGERVRVRVTMLLEGTSGIGRDDGTSIEFSGEVEHAVEI